MSAPEPQGREGRNVIYCEREQGKTPVVITSSPCSHSDSATSAEAVTPAILFEGHMTPEQEARFWIKVVVVEDCWEWVGWTTNGYGRFNHARAHRMSYEHYVGPIPAGLTIDHLCRNRRCVKPSHLEAITCRENILRGGGMAARNASKNHCPLGHEYSLTKSSRGDRICPTCRRAQNRAYKSSKRAIEGAVQ